MAIFNGLDTDALTNTVKAVKENWAMGKTVWKGSAKWEDGFKVDAISREFPIKLDEPDMLCGTNTAANPVEVVLQAYGACLVIGFAMNATVRGVKVESIDVELEGEIDLPGFLGLEPPEELGMDKLPGYKNVKSVIKVKADADADTLNAILADVIKTSPVGLTLSRPVALTTTMEIL